MQLNASKMQHELANAARRQLNAAHVTKAARRQLNAAQVSESS
jgi:hypothetical protein